MQQFNVLDYLILCMRKWAEALVIAIVNVVGVELTEFRLIPVGMVQLLQFIMWEFAVLIVAFLLGADEMVMLDVRRSTLILIIMVVQTSLPLVRFYELLIKMYAYWDTWPSWMYAGQT